MSTDVIMPALGFDMTEGLLARWLKNEGDPVEKGQAIAEIETEKATVEIEAAAAGILARIIVRACSVSMPSTTRRLFFRSISDTSAAERNCTPCASACMCISCASM